MSTPAPVQAGGITLTHWTSVNTTTNVAVGTLGPVAVTLSGGHINSGITDGTSTGFNHPFFTPPLVSSDVVEFLGPNPPSIHTYTVSFSTPVTNPRLHIGSLASTLTFSTVLTKLSGQADFVVAGNTVTGALHNTADPNDSSGTVELEGIFSSFTFTAQALDVFFHGGDGINLQIGADLSSVPDACKGDFNGDNQVTIDEILTSVKNALNACQVPLGIVGSYEGQGQEILSGGCSDQTGVPQILQDITLVVASQKGSVFTGSYTGQVSGGATFTIDVLGTVDATGTLTTGTLSAEAAAGRPFTGTFTGRVVGNNIVLNLDVTIITPRSAADRLV